MIDSPYLEINLTKIEENARNAVERCRPFGVEVVGVTKGFTALPRIVSAMNAGGIEKMADSRIQNIAALRRRRFKNHVTLLRIPKLSSIDALLKYVDCSVNSEYAVIRAISDKAAAAGVRHDIILMVDVGDLREGAMPDEAITLAEQVALLPGVRLAGIGTNMGCYGGILPTIRNLNLLLEVKKEIENRMGFELETVSGGGTSSLRLVEDGTLPDGVNQLRIGEGILLGTDTTHGREIHWLHQDAFLLCSEVIELKTKPSVPIGETGQDAFGNKPTFVDKGMRKRAILALGKQDVTFEGLIPIDPNMVILGGSSDHMIVDVDDCKEQIKVGDMITFRLNYQGLLTSCSSKYIRKKYVVS
ncbi:MAG TPA: alanine/ornithine racemase family PLP-dependent enzyme [Papillibacter sp.]|nr:alanine/ornithine racemase family PLP-dependent enzyme [Papillibacter sp.]